MNSATETCLVTPVPSLEEAAQFTPEQVVGLALSNQQLAQQVSALQAQMDWFKRQIFGQKSERRLFDGEGRQLSLGEIVTAQTVVTASQSASPAS